MTGVWLVFCVQRGRGCEAYICIYLVQNNYCHHVQEPLKKNRLVISSTMRRTYVGERGSVEERKQVYVLLPVCSISNTAEQLQLHNVLCRILLRKDIYGKMNFKILQCHSEFNHNVT